MSKLTLTELGQPSENNLRAKLSDLLKADRWVEAQHSTVAPVTNVEVQSLLKNFPGCVMIVGNGTEFSPDFDPGKDTLILLTHELNDNCEISPGDQTISVSCGRSVVNINLLLAESNFIVPALARFRSGTIGGRLATTPSCSQQGNDDEWMHYLLGLDVILPSGELLSMGSRCIKDVAGYDLKHIFTGSRGTVGIIVSAIFRCKPIESIQWEDPDYHRPNTKKFDPQWKRILDPLGRMHSGA